MRRWARCAHLWENRRRAGTAVGGPGGRLKARVLSANQPLMLTHRMLGVKGIFPECKKDVSCPGLQHMNCPIHIGVGGKPSRTDIPAPPGSLSPGEDRLSALAATTLICCLYALKTPHGQPRARCVPSLPYGRITGCTLGCVLSLSRCTWLYPRPRSRMPAWRIGENRTPRS